MSSLGTLHQGCKSRRIVYRNVGQNLTVEIDAGAFQTIDEFAVRNVGDSAGGVDAYNPQGTEISLLKPAPDITVPQGLLDGFLSGAVQLRFCEEVALGAAKGLVAIISPVGTSFYSWHVFSLIELAAVADCC